MLLLRFAQHFLRNRLSSATRDKVRRYQGLRFRRLQHLLSRALFGSNLKALAVFYSSDKWDNHWYAQYYERHFRHLRKKTLAILEIGIGGYGDPELGGGSLRMWRTYFPRSRVYGIDIADKSPHDERRIKTFTGSQEDADFLSAVAATVGPLNIIIDDGSHRNDHVLKAFACLFPKLVDDGIYVIEDTQTSYWPEYGGSSDDLCRPDTAMGFLKGLADGINHSEFSKAGYQPTYYDQHIVAVHFYHNLVFVQKGLNSEGSNAVWRHAKPC